MTSQGRKVVVVGGTGAIGKWVVAGLLRSSVFTSITLLGRRKVEDLQTCPGEVAAAEASGRLVQHVVDMSRLDAHADQFGSPDVAICCLGTTKKDAGSAEKFREIDLGYTTKFAEVCKARGVKVFGLVTSSNADKNSWFLYPRTKGEAEEAVKAVGFSHVSIYQPGLLDRGDEARWVETVAMKVFVPAIKVQTVGAAIVKDVEGAEGDGKVAIYGNGDLKRLAGEK